MQPFPVIVAQFLEIPAGRSANGGYQGRFEDAFQSTIGDVRDDRRPCSGRSERPPGLGQAWSHRFVQHVRSFRSAGD